MSDLTFLVESLRNYIGDISSPYRFTDDELEVGLYTGLDMLLSRLRFKYTIDESDAITRTSGSKFYQDSPPVIEHADQACIIVQAAIVLKSASAWDASWDVASWKDDEISYSNIQGARSKDQSIANDLKLLDDLLKRRLLTSKLSKMPGFHSPLNTIENM